VALPTMSTWGEGSGGELTAPSHGERGSWLCPELASRWPDRPNVAAPSMGESRTCLHRACPEGEPPCRATPSARRYSLAAVRSTMPAPCSPPSAPPAPCPPIQLGSGRGNGESAFFLFTFFQFYRLSSNSINKTKTTPQNNTNGCSSQWFAHVVVVLVVSGSIPKQVLFLPFIFRDAQVWSQKTCNGVIKRFDPQAGIFLPFIFCDALLSSQKTCKRRHKTYKNTTVTGAVRKLHFVTKFCTFL
jgi:hypothetical protein